MSVIISFSSKFIKYAQLLRNLATVECYRMLLLNTNIESSWQPALNKFLSSCLMSVRVTIPSGLIVDFVTVYFNNRIAATLYLKIY